MAILNRKNGNAPMCSLDPGLSLGLAGKLLRRLFAAPPRSTRAGLRVAPSPKPTTRGAANGLINLTAFPSVRPSSERSPPEATETGASVFGKSPCPGWEIPELSCRAQQGRRQPRSPGTISASPLYPGPWLQRKGALDGENGPCCFPCGADSERPTTPSPRRKCRLTSSLRASPQGQPGLKWDPALCVSASRG